MGTLPRGGELRSRLWGRGGRPTSVRRKSHRNSAEGEEETYGGQGLPGLSGVSE